MNPLPKIYEITRGDVAYLKFPLAVDGVATPVAGVRPFLTIKRSPKDDDPGICQLGLGSGISVYDANSWVAEIPPSATKEQPIATYFYDFQAEIEAGKPQTTESGRIILKPEITHRIA